MSSIFNVTTRKVGGIRFVKIGRLTFSFCISDRYRPIGTRPVRHVRRDVPGASIRFVEYTR